MKLSITRFSLLFLITSFLSLHSFAQEGYVPNAGNLETFSSQLKGSYTTHSFDWQPDWIQFKSIHGHYAEPPDDGYLIHQWLYEGQDNPQEEEELHIHINLWLYQGAVPASGEEVTVAVQAAALPAVAD